MIAISRQLYNKWLTFWASLTLENCIDVNVSQGGSDADGEMSRLRGLQNRVTPIEVSKILANRINRIKQIFETQVDPRFNPQTE